MSLTINTNISALRTDRQLSQRTSALQNNFQTLSSGRRINNASDDPAGLAIALELLATADTEAVAARNISDGVSIANIADSALGTASDITTRLNELAVQSSNGTLSSDQRAALNNEFQQLTSELNRISQTTEFNGQQLLSSDSSISIQAGTSGGSESQIRVDLPGVSSNSLGITADISTQAGAQEAIEQTKNATQTIAASRGSIGASVSRLETSFQNIVTSEINQRAAASRILDADVAKEAADLVANRIGQEAGLAIKAQANAGPGLALRLLG